MNIPHMTCYMMTSVDGRIDCDMTGSLPGVEEYYPLLDELNFDACISGRVTAELEMAEAGRFSTDTHTPVLVETVSNKATTGEKLEIIADTKGTLLWKDNAAYDEHVLILTSEQVSREYLAYVDEKGISYIATGKERIDLARAMEILADTFGVRRVGVVGGAAINTAFLDAGLLDEVILLIGAGIDGRAAFPPVFNRVENKAVTPLRLVDMKAFDSGAVCIRYQV